MRQNDDGRAGVREEGAPGRHDDRGGPRRQDHRARRRGREGAAEGQRLKHYIRQQPNMQH